MSPGKERETWVGRESKTGGNETKDFQIFLDVIYRRNKIGTVIWFGRFQKMYNLDGILYQLIAVAFRKDYIRSCTPNQ